MSGTNPHLPPPPADGKHDFNGHKGGRCLACGAYYGSPESVSICLGEYRESGKMRMWAARKWTQERAAGKKPQKVVQTVVRTPAKIRVGITTMVPSSTVSVVLACGCEHFIEDEETSRMAEFGELEELNCERIGCAEEMVREHLELNPGIKR